jgi:hypothetical protein
VMEYAKVVHLVRIPREALLAVTVDPKGSWTSYTPMYVDR